MRVVSFNIHHGTVGRRGPVDPEQLGAVCASFDADVIALQEVDRDTYRTGRADLAAIAAGACGMAHVFGGSRWFPGGRYGNALLARGTLTDVEVVSHPKVPEHRFWQERRTAICAAVEVDGWRLQVVATHLAVPRPINGVQLEAMLHWAQDRPGPTVVMGDFNRPAGLVGPEAATAGLRAVEHAPTFPAHRPKRTIDHVLVSTDLRVTRNEVRVTPMSDHAALIVDVERADLESAR